MILLHNLSATNFKQFENVEMAFPEAGTVLIEGHNESGKSSLFEAAYFALYGDGLNGLKNDALIRYKSDTAKVTLTFSVDGRRFVITRQIRSRNNTTTADARLTIPQADGSDEVVNGVRAVNKLIVDELGMSAQALLNTCFVEQKGLEKLESLNSKEREDTINELVNLSAFTQMEVLLGKAKDDTERVAVSRKRVELARLDANFGNLETERDRLQTVFAVATLREIDERERKAHSDQKAFKELGQRISTVTAWHDKRERITTLRDQSLKLWQDAHATAIEKRTAMKSAEDAQAKLPDLRAKLLEAETFQTRLVRLIAIEAEETREANWQATNAIATQAATNAETALTKAKQKSADAGKAYEAGISRDAVKSWETATAALARVEQPRTDPELVRLDTKAKQAEKDANIAEELAVGAETKADVVYARVDDTCKALRRKIAEQPVVNISATNHTIQPSTPAAIGTPNLAYATLGIGVVLAGLGAVISLTILLILGILLLAVGGFWTFTAMQSAARERAKHAEISAAEARAQELRINEAQKKLQDYATQCAEWEKQINSAQLEATEARGEANIARQAATNAVLSAANAQRIFEQYQNGITQSQAAAVAVQQQLISDTVQQMNSLSITPLPETIQDAQSLLTTFHAVFVALGVEVTTPTTQLKSFQENAYKEREKAQNKYQDSLKAVTKYQVVTSFTPAEKLALSTVRTELENAGLPTTDELLLKDIQSQRTVLSNTEELAKQLLALKEKMTHAEQIALKYRTAFAKQFAELLDSVHDFVQKIDGERTFPETAGIAEAQLLLSEWNEEFRVALLQEPELSALTSGELQAESRRITTQLGSLANELVTLHEQETKPRTLLNLKSQPLDELLPSLLLAHPDASVKTSVESETAFADARRAVESNRIVRKTQASELNITDDSLDLPTELAALEAAELQRDTNNTARDILKRTRTLILERVMPRTEGFVKRILPRLTDDRYRDIRWVADKNLIQVFDKRREDYVEKKVFSGGARDQISLALRLAFALATLPGGTATRPGWLFLDEPLSAFDEKRTRALIDLLTKGLLKEQFHQIFLVSHSKSFDAERFMHRVEMVDGSIQSKLAV